MLVSLHEKCYYIEVELNLSVEKAQVAVLIGKQAVRVMHV